MQERNTDMTIDFALLGVFPIINWQSEVHKNLNDPNQSIYWLPWGNRQKNLAVALQHLVAQCNWKLVEQKTYSLYSSGNENINALKFFHHDSKKQGGDGKIKYRYDIKYVAISKVPFGPSKNITHNLTEDKSETWFGICGYKSARRLREPMDFASDFEIIESLKTWKKHQMHETKDAYLLYSDVAIVSHFTHGKRNPCNCPHCLPLK
jgi:hypothetical protein